MIKTRQRDIRNAIRTGEAIDLATCDEIIKREIENIGYRVVCTSVGVYGINACMQLYAVV